MITQYVDSLSTYAQDIDDVFILIFWMVLFWTILCFAAFFHFLWKFRARPGHKAQYVTGETKEEKNDDATESKTPSPTPSRGRGRGFGVKNLAAMRARSSFTEGGT